MTRAEVEDFLFEEAALLDAWQLDAWLALWTDDGRYVIPATDAPAGDPRPTLALVADDLPQLRSRVQQLASGQVHAEVPRARTTRLVGNVRIVARREDALVVTSNVIVHRSRRGRDDTFAGRVEHELREVGARPRIARKTIVLAHDTLARQGKISILL